MKLHEDSLVLKFFSTHKTLDHTQCTKKPNRTSLIGAGHTPPPITLPTIHHQSVYEDRIDCYWCSQLSHAGLHMSDHAVIFLLVW